MKEQNVTTFNKDYSKAIIYSKKILSKSLYHSSNVKKKLEVKFDKSIASYAMMYLKNNKYFDDLEYINELKNMCKSKFYGIKKFNSILLSKNISIKESNYTFDEENEVLRGYLIKLKKRLMKFNEKDRKKKLLYYLNYHGFSAYNISRVNFIDIIF